MDEKKTGGKRSLSRRDVLWGAGAAGAAAGSTVATAHAAPPEPPRREALEALTAREADALEAFCARLIPTDAAGPGAREARAAYYIDRALAGALASSREAYRTGLTALDERARSAHGSAFAQLSPELQNAVLTDTETRDADFFALVRAHTLQGMFSDPYYGGNANFIGWDMIGYPGVRLAAAAELQKMNPQIKPTHQSAFDFPMFNRAGANPAASGPPAPHDMDMPRPVGGAGSAKQ
ncbi:MAG TPA: gluconate 2-dehydrogenase subunit 3 family protein [Caulobacterales bacterium]|nr:gluconate 2-dehydrogenase subunit 3 family protein [Caulobacterales bacterium]